MVQLQEVYLSVAKIEGGYIVDTQNGRQVITSLPKVVKLIKEILEPELKVVSR